MLKQRLLSTLVAATLALGTATAFAAPIAGVTASGSDANIPAMSIDNNLSTRWSAEGSAWIQYDMGSAQTLQNVKIAFHKGSERNFKFDLLTSADGITWATAGANLQSQKNNNLQTFSLNNASGRYVRYVGKGNTQNNWNSLSEVQIASAADAGGGGGGNTGGGGNNGGSSKGTSIAKLKEYFEVEGNNPYVADGTLRFSALESKYKSPNGNGWRNEVKIKEELRKNMAKTYEDFSADVKVTLSKGAKTIVAQHHEDGLGTIVKVYVADTRDDPDENQNAISADGIFDVFVRITRMNGGKKEEVTTSFGTIRSGETFRLDVSNHNGNISVTALGRTVTEKAKDAPGAYFKFGDYLQAQNPITMKKCSRDAFEKCYKDAGITQSVIEMTNVVYTRE
jgi:hypothetical protein